jgi:hypothetical protein
MIIRCRWGANLKIIPKGNGVKCQVFVNTVMNILVLQRI